MLLSAKPVLKKKALLPSLDLLSAQQCEQQGRGDSGRRGTGDQTRGEQRVGEEGSAEPKPRPESCQQRSQCMDNRAAHVLHVCTYMYQ